MRAWALFATASAEPTPKSSERYLENCTAGPPEARPRGGVTGLILEDKSLAESGV